MARAAAELIRVYRNTAAVFYLKGPRFLAHVVSEFLASEAPPRRFSTCLWSWRCTAFRFAALTMQGPDIISHLNKPVAHLDKVYTRPVLSFETTG